MSLDDIPDDKIVGHAQLVTTPYAIEGIKYQFYALLKEPLPTEPTKKDELETIITGNLSLHDYDLWEIDERTINQLPKEMRQWLTVLNLNTRLGVQAYCFYIVVEEVRKRRRLVSQWRGLRRRERGLGYNLSSLESTIWPVDDMGVSQ